MSTDDSAIREFFTAAAEEDRASLLASIEASSDVLREALRDGREDLEKIMAAPKAVPPSDGLRFRR